MSVQGWYAYEGDKWLPNRRKRVVRNPYASVDWATFKHYKANLHSHTQESDGQETVASVIDLYHAWRYDILAITDHYTNTWPWTDYGRDPDTMDPPILAVRGNEAGQTDHHVLAMLTDWPSETTKSGPASIPYVDANGGYTVFAHPGRYDETDDWYLQWHLDYASVRGIEIRNQGNRFNDTPLWDRLLELAAPQDLSVWGHSTDDMHTVGHLGRNYHVHMMPALTTEAFEKSMTDGAFFAVYDWDGRKIESHVNDQEPGFWVPGAIVDNITVDDLSIAIDARQVETYTWYSNGQVVGNGPELALTSRVLGAYVRAELRIGSVTTYTQPFYLR